MNLLRWEPFRDTEDFIRSGWPRSFRRLVRSMESDKGVTETEWSPGADISENAKEYLIRAELPGVKKEDVHVTIEEGAIRLSGERKMEKEEKGAKYHRVESFHGTFSRSFALPDDVDAKAIYADSKDGVLCVHLPKTPSEKTKPVEIKIQ